MKVSIIIPVYNVAAYLDRCIRSALALKTPLELIVIDDGSTDGSGALCDAWAAKDARIVLIRQNNRGLPATRNQGIRESRGEYILFLDGDDFLDPEQTDCLLDSIDGSQCVAMGLYRNYDSGRERFEKERCAAFLPLWGDIPMERFLRAVPENGGSCYMIAPRFVVKREFLLENGLFFHENLYHEDEEWTQRLLCCAENMFVTHYYFYCYRRNRSGAITSAVTLRHIQDSLRILCLSDTLRQAQEPIRQRYLLSRMAQLYLNVLIHVPGLPPQERERIFPVLEQYRTLCLPYLSGPVGVGVRLLVRAVGIRRGGSALWKARTVKKKWQGG